MDQRRAKMSSGSQNLNSNCKSKQLEVQDIKCVRKWKAREEPPIMSYSRFGCLNHGPPLAALVKDNITTLILTLANSKYLNAIIHVFWKARYCRSDEGTKSISNKAITRLVAAIKRLREVKIGRMQRNLMDTPAEEQQMFQSVTCKIAASEHSKAAVSYENKGNWDERAKRNQMLAMMHKIKELTNNLRKMIDLLIHASQCRSPHFQYPNFQTMKRLFPCDTIQNTSDDSEDDLDDSDVYVRFFIASAVAREAARAASCLTASFTFFLSSLRLMPSSVVPGNLNTRYLRVTGEVMRFVILIAFMDSHLLIDDENLMVERLGRENI
ncbi:65-kDa microtubule-associated protein 3-like protein [Tanacetum coccineum]